MDLPVGGSFLCCLIIVAIFIGIGRADRLGGDFEVIIGGGKPRRDGTIFMGKFNPSRQHAKILIWQLEEG